MPRRSKGVRLYLRERKGREPQYFIVDGRREVATGCGHGAIEQANEKLSEYLSTIRPNTKERNLAKIGVIDVIQLYGQEAAPRKASVKTIGFHIRALSPFWSGKMLSDIKASTCRAYEAYRAAPRDGKPGVKSSTARRELKTLQAAIKFWHKESPLPSLPSFEMPEESPRRERVLSRKEAAALLRAARKRKVPHVARFILIGLYTGTRHNAILQLHWTPQHTGGHIDVESNILYRRGHGERETSKRRPPIQVPRKLRGFIQRWRRQDQDRGVSRVVNFEGTRILKMKRAWAGVVKAAGLGKDVTPHVLRHTCASWALWNGATIWDVAGLIGADATTVERVYGHHRPIVEERKRA